MDNEKPTCNVNETTHEENCRDQQLWLGFYSDFAKRRKAICDMGAQKRKRSIGYGRSTIGPSPYEPVF
ncbi:MAG: hypothetical protein M1839_007788 [Geoglossum umbratile]|nr:MAG: hypothetical protein M1839_007788 [Geoglossum umbratile]